MTAYAPYEPIYTNDDDAFVGPENESNSGRTKEDIEDCPPPGPKVVCPTCPMCPTCPVCPEPPPPSDNRYDTFLFVFSGILLLFVMEQFLQLGIAIGARSALPFDSFSAR
jgi:hypothetical protein